jgi:hypothetical protein
MPVSDHNCINRGDTSTRPRTPGTRRGFPIGCTAARRNVEQPDRHRQPRLISRPPHTSSPSHSPTSSERRKQPCKCSHFRGSTVPLRRPVARWGSTPAVSASFVAARSDSSGIHRTQRRRGAPQDPRHCWAGRWEKHLAAVTSRRRGPTVLLYPSQRPGGQDPPPGVRLGA